MDASCDGDFKRAIAEAKAAGIEHERKRLIRYAYHLVQRHHEKITRVASELVERKSGTMSAYMVHRFTFHSKDGIPAHAPQDVGRPERENIAGMLYHYTSAKLLEKIIASGKLRPSDARGWRLLWATSARDHRPYVRILP